MEQHGDGKPDYLTPVEFISLVLYGVLYVLTFLLALNFYHYNESREQAHAAQHEARPTDSQCAELEAQMRRNAPRPNAQAEGEHPSIPARLWEHAIHGLSLFWQDPTGATIHRHPAAPMSRQQACLTVHEAFIYDALNERMHEKPTEETSLAKILIVTVVSALWFRTFLTANHVTRAWERSRWSERWRSRSEAAVRRPNAAVDESDASSCAQSLRRIRDGVSAWLTRLPGELLTASRNIKAAFAVLGIVPVVPFILAMHREYEPAVFIMALVAIFVAAEHYGGLANTEHELKLRTAELKTRIDIVLDADGLNQWRTEVYQLYSKATYRVDAVIRKFDIDEQWWLGAAATDQWQAYVDACDNDNRTLLFNLRRCSAHVQLVADLPMSASPTRAVPTDAEKATFFRHLLGLAWYLVVFELVHEHRLDCADYDRHKPPPYLRIKIGHAPCWMHVIDDTVYQVIERGNVGNSTVRKLSANGTSDAHLLGGWARENVRTMARQGGRAEEYVFALLHRSAIAQGISDDAPLRIALLAILQGLGLNEYLNQPKEEFLMGQPGETSTRMNRTVRLSMAWASASCVAVFQGLLDKRFGRNTCQVGHWPDKPPLVCNLACETL